MSGISKKSDYLRKVFLEIEKVEEDERSIVIIAHGFMELLINTLIENKCKNHKKILQNRSEFSHSSKIVLLNELGYINDKEFKVLDKFRKIRNKAAHEPLFKLYRDDLRYFSIFEPSSNDVKTICQRVISMIWNKYNLVFYPIFG